MIEDTLHPVQVLRWYLDAGVDEAIGETPVDRYAASAAALAPAPAPDPGDGRSGGETRAARPAPDSGDGRPARDRPEAHPAPLRPSPSGAPPATPDAVKSAYALASAAADLDALRAALAGFTGCPLQAMATNLVFGDGNPKARIVLIGEAPGADEDRLGVPFVGASGRLLDKMLASIGLARADVFISNTVFWRPPGNRTPNASEVAVCAPFVERLLELIDPEVVVALGGAAASALLGKTESVGKLRGKWHEYATPRLSRPVAAAVLYHPAYLLRSPGQKRNAWRDLLAIKRKLSQL